jgi:hypothetical protein
VFALNPTLYISDFIKRQTVAFEQRMEEMTSVFVWGIGRTWWVQGRRWRAVSFIISFAQKYFFGRRVEVGQRKTIEIISKQLFLWCEERKNEKLSLYETQNRGVRIQMVNFASPPLRLLAQLPLWCKVPGNRSSSTPALMAAFFLNIEVT